MHSTKPGLVVLRLCSLAIALATAHPATAASDAPSRAVVEQVLQANWDRPATSSGPKTAVTLNAVKFGKSAKATMSEYQVDGIPQQATVTPAVVDFTVRSYYASETQVVRRVREARIYKDKMDEWALMTGSPKGQDVTTKEPPVKQD
jgi:hypothetical protein